MKTLKTLLGVALIAAPLGLAAQTDTRTRYAAGDATTWGPRAGDHEVTIGGAGFANRDLDSSAGGVNASYGWYLNDTLLFSVRQGISYTNPSSGGSAWSGSTRLALDQHLLPRGAFRPFVGVNFGGVYGDNTNDTWVAGLEGGVKFYVSQNTFVFGLADYAWSFRNASRADNNFSDGGFSWTLGLGFNF
jgi:hypothetical protein